MININTNPYYDDFSADKNFHQILVRPGYSVQARELTQIQSILRDQIAKFGSHIFKHGSVVIPGNTNSDLNVCYVKLVGTLPSVNLVEADAIDTVSGLKAKIRIATAQTSTDAATLFVSYYNTGSNGERVFGDGVTLDIVTTAGSVSVVTGANACGGAALAFISPGVFFINGSFVSVQKQTAIISKYSNTPSARVGLIITEEIIDSNIDSSLLDPAQGSDNYAGPGADRLKISLTLTAIANTDTVGQDFVELMRFEAGVLVEQSLYPKYSELEKSLARRTFDESGDYISSGLALSLSESAKKKFNGGKFVDGSIDDYAVQIDPGKAYISGFETEIISPRVITAPKGRVTSPNHILSRAVNISPNYGQYLFVTNLKGLPDFVNRTVVNLYDSVASNGSATQIGTAQVISIDLHDTNSNEQTGIYRLYLTDISTTSDLHEVGSVRYSGGSADVLHRLTVPVNGVDFVANDIVSYGSYTATVNKWVRSSSALYVYKHTVGLVPTTGIKITGSVSGASGVVLSDSYVVSNAVPTPIIQLPTDATFKVKKNIGTGAVPVYSPNITYKVYKQLSMTMSGGFGSVTISGGTIDPIDAGNSIVTSSTANLPVNRLTLSPDGLTLTYTGPESNGTVIKAIVAVTKPNVTNKTKTLVSNSSSPDTGLTPSANVALSKADIVRIVSVISTVDGDVTARFKLNNGQTDYAYLPGSLLLVAAMPAGTLTAVYEYFSHSGTGDFFSVDSYASSGLTDYYGSMSNYVSSNDKTVFNLRNCLDFRPRFDATPSTIDMVVVDSRISTDVQYYVSRIDAVCIDKSGNTFVVNGTPAEVPVAPALRVDSIQLGTVFVPAYTYKIADMYVTASKYKGYKMRDILTLENRVSRLEQYSMLSKTESNLINLDVIDAATGLTRHKSGYLVETFDDIEKIADFQNSDFKVSYIGGELKPLMERYDVPLELVSTTGTVTGNDGNLNKTVTLNYTYEAFAEQKQSTRVSNINPFSVFSWKGQLKLMPSVDNFVNVTILPPKFETVTNYVTENVIVDIPRYWAFRPVPGQMNTFAPAPSGWPSGAAFAEYAARVHANDAYGASNNNVDSTTGN
jgi:Domain of unknown function (DUF4815)